jgi:hypothetical protein
MNIQPTGVKRLRFPGEKPSFPEEYHRTDYPNFPGILPGEGMEENPLPAESGLTGPVRGRYSPLLRGMRSLPEMGSLSKGIILIAYCKPPIRRIQKKKKDLTLADIFWESIMSNQGKYLPQKGVWI